MDFILQRRHLSLSEKVLIVKSYYKGGESVRKVLDVMKERHGIQPIKQNALVVRELIQAFETTGSIRNVANCCRKVKIPATVETKMELPEGEEVIEVDMVSVDDEDVKPEIQKEDPEAPPATPTPNQEELDLCPHCGKTCIRKHFRSHLQSHDKKRVLKCPECNEEFPNRSSLYRHKLTHKPPVQLEFICEICAKVSTTKKTHEVHLLVHSTEKPHQCPFCPMKFVRPHGLRQHKLTHTGEKPYVCKYCGAAFAAHMSHQMHVRLHTGERPFKCKHCGDSFIGQPALNTHLRKHEGEYEHQCELCRRRFKTEKTLQEHLDKKHGIVQEVIESVVGEAL